jgi:transposase
VVWLSTELEEVSMGVVVALDVHRQQITAIEGTTGWRFIVEEIERAGDRADLADPAETAAKRGAKRRAKTDDADCELQLRLLCAGELPESWIPPEQILELRARVRLRTTLLDERASWQQRIHSQLFDQGVPPGVEATDSSRPEGARGS